MPTRLILIIGGTAEARLAAEVLHKAGWDTITSLAGVTAQPVLPMGRVRQGGFGGADGLHDYLCTEHIAAVVDASHAFARQISRHAHDAAARAGVPYVRLERPPWVPAPDQQWTTVATISAAAAVLPAGALVLLTIGRKDIAPFVARADVSGVIRMIEPPSLALPLRWRLLLARPPFTRADELALMQAEAISHLVCKNAGGAQTAAKLAAAREAGVTIVMVARPEKPPAQVVERAEDLPDLLRSPAL
jgi:precorrin-6A/cobalt-precorrin-6A reductase